MAKPRKKPANRSPRVYAYARVSTTGQAEDGVSLDAQVEQLRAYAVAHGLDLVEVVLENGSAKTVARRPALRRVLRELERGEADGLVVPKLDRLSRSVRDVLDLADDATRRGWQLHSIAESLNTATPSGRFTLTVLAALAEMERAQTGERTKAALAHLRAQGKRTSGRPPFGYRFKDGREEPVQREQRILERMVELRDEGHGARRIAGRLEADGVKNPRTRGAFTTGTVAAILRTHDRRAGG